MEIIYLYCAFSYLFMTGFSDESDAPGWARAITWLAAPIAVPVFVGKFIGSVSTYED